ncbi:uncharacterized protein KZ484_011018 [Pholidichthys leucotaenia]
MESQKKLLSLIVKSEIKLQTTTDFPHQPECEKEEILADQQLCNQEKNSVLDQQGPEPPQVKEEQEELCISQEGEQLVVKLEADPFMVILISEKNQLSEAEPNSEQLLSHNSAGTEIQDEEGSWHVDSGSTKEEEPKPKKRRLKARSNSDEDSLTSKTLCENETDAPQLHDCKEEILTVQQLCNQDRNSSLEQEELDAAQVKEEEELCTSQEEEHFGLKQEIDTFMVIFTDEGTDSSETEPKSEQFLMSENQCDTDTGEKSVKCSVSENGCKNESQKKKRHTVKSHVCNTCGKRFRNKSHVSVHERIHTAGMMAGKATGMVTDKTSGVVTGET